MASLDYDGDMDSTTLNCRTAYRIGAACAIWVWAFLAGSSSSVRAEDWYRWRGPSGDGISRETDWSSDWPNGKPKIAWKFSAGTGFSSIVVRGDRVYTIGHIDEHDVVHCLDVASGRVLWQHAYSAPLDDRDFEGGPTSTPTIDENRLYVLSREGDLLCLRADTGAVQWEKQVANAAQVRLPGWGFSAAPLVVGDKLLLNIGESGAALNKHDGSLIWSSADKECGYATPVVIPQSDPPTVVIASARAYVGVAVDSGEQLWNERWLTSFNCNAADPIVHNGRMFLSSGYNRGSALFEFVDGMPRLVWKTKEMQNQLHSSLLYQGHLYGIDGNMEHGARLKCLDWSTGDVLWSVSELRPGGLSLAGGKLLLLSEAGELVIAPATPQGWRPIARAQILEGKCWTAPVLSSGRVYCRSVEGEIACVDCRE